MSRPTDADGNGLIEGALYEGKSRGLVFVCRAQKQNGEWVPVPHSEFSKQWEHMLYRWNWDEATLITTDPE